MNVGFHATLWLHNIWDDNRREGEGTVPAEAPGEGGRQESVGKHRRGGTELGRERGKIEGRSLGGWLID